MMLSALLKSWALANIARGTFLFGLATLYFHLPDIPGDEILRQLRADSRTEQIPIVMISADAASAPLDRLRAAGANDYLTKPIDVRAFLALVDATEPRAAV